MILDIMVAGRACK
ncbi:unnamed protein product [Cuscuta epithymum]|uniref:Uncharacterized protein n=1 Tax=Cuscuta epithymum TaxID=186058 RepID=A0AAV0D360_9ASTE|nr:unnamed protein product [Cuscuta epithymum]